MRTIKTVAVIIAIAALYSLVSGCANSVSYRDADGCSVTMRGYMWAASAPENAKLGCRE